MSARWGEPREESWVQAIVQLVFFLVAGAGFLLAITAT